MANAPIAQTLLVTNNGVFAQPTAPVQIPAGPLPSAPSLDFSAAENSGNLVLLSL